MENEIKLTFDTGAAAAEMPKAPEIAPQPAQTAQPAEVIDESQFS